MPKARTDWPPLVSVITPVFNAAPFLEETLESVQAQDYARIEHIVIDDGSTDDSPVILRRHQAAGRIRLRSQANAGEAAAANAGARLATGAYLTMVNADDPIRPGHISAAVRMLEEDPSLAAVYPDWLRIDASGGVLAEVVVAEYDYRLLLEQSLCLPGPGAVIRRSVLAGEPLRDPRFRYKADFHLWLRLGLRHPMARLPGAYATWRDHGAGATWRHGTSRRMAEEHQAVIEDILSRPDLPDHARQWQRHARSVAAYLAALVAIHNSEVPGRRLLARSFRLAPVWPRRFHPDRRRSWVRIAYIVARPMTDWIYQSAVGLGLVAERPALRGRRS